jgi:ABC-type glutathione transport system ATPase component
MAIARRGSKEIDISEEIAKVLSAVELPARVSSALPSELSGGMCQRAALAIAVAPNPKLVIADEPETGLDPILRRSVIELLVRVTKEYKSGLLLISHHEDSVKRIADQVVHLRPGGKGL